MMNQSEQTPNIEMPTKKVYYMTALKEYNKGKTFCHYAKETPEYKEVSKLYKLMKSKAKMQTEDRRVKQKDTKPQEHKPTDGKEIKRKADMRELATDLEEADLTKKEQKFFDTLPEQQQIAVMGGYYNFLEQQNSNPKHWSLTQYIEHNMYSISPVVKKWKEFNSKR